MSTRARRWCVILGIAAVGCTHVPGSGSSSPGRIVEYAPETLPANFHPLVPNEPSQVIAACSEFRERCTPSLAIVRRDFANGGNGAFAGSVIVITRVGPAPEPFALQGLQTAFRDAPVDDIEVGGDDHAELRTTRAGCDERTGIFAGTPCGSTHISWAPERGVHVDVLGNSVSTDETIAIARSLRARPLDVDEKAVPWIIGRAPQPPGHRGAGKSVQIVLRRTGDNVCLGVLLSGCYWSGEFNGRTKILALPSDDSDYAIGVAPSDVRSLRFDYADRTIEVPTIGQDADVGVVAFALYYPESVLPMAVRAVHRDGHVTVVCADQDECRDAASSG